jgi:nucleotide-binding universal stress UspA family protein
MKKILFPTDLSEAANKAFIYALHIADKMEASILTLHVYQRPQVKSESLPRTLQEFYENYDLHDFEDYKDSIPSLRNIQQEHGFSSLNVSHILRQGDKVVPTILQVAEEEEVELIIMGTTGARGLKEIFLGSVAGEILENASCPVLAVPESSSFDGVINTIGMTTNFKDEEKTALQRVHQIFKPFHPQIYCVNVDLAHIAEYTSRMDDFSRSFDTYNNIHFEVVQGNEFRDVLTQFMNEQSIDILAMVIHQRSFLEELFSYSRTKHMSYHSKVPVLSIPESTL